MNDSPTQDTFESLAARALRGEARAFDQLWYDVSPTLLTRLRHLGRLEDVEDAIAHAWSDLLEGKARYNPTEPFFPFIYRVTANKLYSLKRKGRRIDAANQPLEEFPDAAHGSAVPLFDLPEWHLKVADCWESLPAEDRERICMRYPNAPAVFLEALSQVHVEHIKQLISENPTCEQIAQQAQTTAKIIQNRIWRAVARFCRCLEISLPPATPSQTKA